MFGMSLVGCSLNKEQSVSKNTQTKEEQLIKEKENTVEKDANEAENTQVVVGQPIQAEEFTEEVFWKLLKAFKKPLEHREDGTVYGNDYASAEELWEKHYRFISTKETAMAYINDNFTVENNRLELIPMDMGLFLDESKPLDITKINVPTEGKEWQKNVHSVSQLIESEINGDSIVELIIFQREDKSWVIDSITYQQEEMSQETEEVTNVKDFTSYDGTWTDSDDYCGNGIFTTMEFTEKNVAEVHLGAQMHGQKSRNCENIRPDGAEEKAIVTFDNNGRGTFSFTNLRSSVKQSATIQLAGDKVLLTTHIVAPGEYGSETYFGDGVTTELIYHKEQ